MITINTDFLSISFTLQLSWSNLLITTLSLLFVWFAPLFAFAANNDSPLVIIFVCDHHSRRSQFRRRFLCVCVFVCAATWNSYIIIFKCKFRRFCSHTPNERLVAVSSSLYGVVVLSLLLLSCRRARCRRECVPFAKTFRLCIWHHHRNQNETQSTPQ